MSAGRADWTVTVHHVERVKWYAPRVRHIVVDVELRPPQHTLATLTQNASITAPAAEPAGRHGSDAPGNNASSGGDASAMTSAGANGSGNAAEVPGGSLQSHAVIFSDMLDDEKEEAPAAATASVTATAAAAAAATATATISSGTSRTSKHDENCVPWFKRPRDSLQSTPVLHAPTREAFEARVRHNIALSLLLLFLTTRHATASKDDAFFTHVGHDLLCKCHGMHSSPTKAFGRSA